MAGALDGLVVVDLTSHLSGPYAAMMLADHGADVLKIERPEAGDDARRMPPFIAGESAPFMVWNRNKRSVELDLKSVEGKARLLELVDGADILIENMRPGVMNKLGLGYSRKESLCCTRIRDPNPKDGPGRSGPPDQKWPEPPRPAWPAQGRRRRIL
jgi:crotonobetainyl-CoA:carnitine CoA-transferase CaiB-like acyl-CoA transferase